MRLSEKTLELSFCAQLAQHCDLQNIIWFGLTQIQERRLAFDVCSKINGRLIILQFKASNVIIKPTLFRPFQQRRFTIPHDQLIRLRALSTGLKRTVYYVFPNIGTTNELNQNRDIIQQTWLLDVAELPEAINIPMPTNRARCHYAYINPPLCELRSEPLVKKLLNTLDVFKNLQNNIKPNSQQFVKWCQERRFEFKGLRTYGLLLPAD